MSCENLSKEEMIFLIKSLKERVKILEESSERANQYLDVAGVMMIVLDKEGKILLVNKKGCEILGHKETDILGKNWFDNFLSSSEKNNIKWVHSQIMSGSLNLLEYVENSVITSLGQEKIISWHNSVLKDKEGNIVGALSSGQDITEQKKTLAVLRKNVSDLEQFKAFSVDRENRMLDLKKEVNRLSEELGRSAPYNLKFLEKNS